MKIRWLGWAAAEIALDGAAAVIDPLLDAGAVFAPLGEVAEGVEQPVIEPATEGAAALGLVTHLHRDHADAEALVAALKPGSPVLEPVGPGGEAIENLALAQADTELGSSGLDRIPVPAWEARRVGPFEVAALPAVDGSGDPQVSWALEAGGVRVLHLGDTTFHGYWWRMKERFGPFDLVLVPINGARLTFPHRQPPSPFPGVMDPEQAATAAHLVGARLAVPIHHGGYALEGIYEPVDGAVERFAAACEQLGVEHRVLSPGESLELEAKAPRDESGW